MKINYYMYMFFTFVCNIIDIDVSYGSDTTRCLADLGRVKPSFCINEKNAESGKKLDYKWKLNDNSYDLTANICISNSENIGARQDLILAIDRSGSIKYADAIRRKNGGDNISLVRDIIRKISEEAKQHPEVAPKVGLVLFSTSANCVEFAGGAINMGREFPCNYLPAKPSSDSAHVDNLLAMLSAAEGKYSEADLSVPAGNTAAQPGKSSDYTIISGLMTTGKLTVSPSSALILFSDGGTFSGGVDLYPNLRVADYLQAQAAAKKSFSQLSDMRVVVAFASTPAPRYGADLFGTAMENMCALPDAPSADCDQGTVKLVDASSWLVNKLDLKEFAVNLAMAAGGTSDDVVVVNAKGDLDLKLEQLRISKQSLATIDSVTMESDSGNHPAVDLNGRRFIAHGLGAGLASEYTLTIKAAGKSFAIPMHLTTEKIEENAQDAKELVDSEMYCAAPPMNFVEQESPALKHLQGGSASCGVVSSGDEGSMSAACLISLPVFGLAAAALIGRRRRLGQAAMLLMLGAPFSLTDSAHAGEGVNIVQFHPVVGGVGNTESASTPAPGTYNIGIFGSYAYHPLEVGGDNNKRDTGIVDNLLSADFVASLALFERTSFSVDVPYIYKSDVKRQLDQGETIGGNIGRPADTQMMVKFQLLSRHYWSLALAPLVTLPTGNSDLLIGDGQTNYGGLLLASGGRGDWLMAANLGYLERRRQILVDERTNPIVVRGQELVSGGLGYRATSAFTLATNVQAKFSAGERADFNANSPAEWSLSGNYRTHSAVEYSAGGGTGIGKGYGSPAYRLFVGIGYVPHPAGSVSATSTQANGRR